MEIKVSKIRYLLTSLAEDKTLKQIKAKTVL